MKERSEEDKEEEKQGTEERGWIAAAPSVTERAWRGSNDVMDVRRKENARGLGKRMGGREGK